MMKISIIVPVFNAQSTLKECVSSILAQTVSDFELILVDDHSSDGSRRLCEHLKEMDSRIKIMSLPKNGGVSNARNQGLNIAKGKYVMFCDNDDIVASDWISHLLVEVEKNENVLPISSMATNLKNLGKKNVIEGRNLCEELNANDYYAFNMAGIAGYVWNTIYRRDILVNNNIRFRSRRDFGDINEDLMFSLDYVRHIRKLKYTGYADYFHAANNTNHSSSTDLKFYFEKYQEKYTLWRGFFLQEGQGSFEKYIGDLANVSLYHFLHALSFQKKASPMEELFFVKAVVRSTEMGDVLKYADLKREDSKIIWLVRRKCYFLLWLMLKISH